MTDASGFKDHFSGHASGYRAARPGYPPALFAWLAERAPNRARAWDVGCGNGQASAALAGHFAEVIATDASAAQIAQAAPHPNVQYRAQPAEATTLAAQSVDLITVAQALHWFDLPRFYAEVRRVARPGALMAVWTYALCAITADVDAIVARLYEDVLGPYWPPERHHAENGYASLPLPFTPEPVPAFEMTAEWTLPQFCAYLETWSALQRYKTAHGGANPLAGFTNELAAAWGSAEATRAVRWPLTVRAGHLPGG